MNNIIVAPQEKSLKQRQQLVAYTSYRFIGKERPIELKIKPAKHQKLKVKPHSSYLP